MSHAVYAANRPFDIWGSPDEPLFVGAISECFTWLENHPEYHVDDINYYCDDIYVTEY